MHDRDICNLIAQNSDNNCDMESSLFIAFAAFAFVTVATPGPNNLMLMASGANFGFGRTLPHILGVGLGFSFMVAVVGAGLGRLFETYPAIHAAMKIASVAYLVFLAWKIARSAGVGEGSATARPFTFLQAAGFQWINPKAWAMALTAVSAYAPGREPAAILLVALVYAGIGLPTISLWVVAGREIRRFLTDLRHLRIFNIAMAALLVASLYPIVFAR